MRRSLEARNNERIAAAAVTPQAFVAGVERAMAGHEDPLRSTMTLSVEEVAELEQLDRELDRETRRPSGAPRSFGPGNDGPEITDI